MCAYDIHVHIHKQPKTQPVSQAWASPSLHVTDLHRVVELRLHMTDLYRVVELGRARDVVRTAATTTNARVQKAVGELVSAIWRLLNGVTPTN